MTESPAEGGSPRAEPLRWLAFEAVAAVLTSALFIASCLLIRVHPIDRIGQVSGLASLGLRFVLFALAMVVALVVASRRSERSFALVSRLVCAAMAALATAMVADDILVALRNTPFGINGRGGDIGVIAEWAASLHRGEGMQPAYPPLAVHVLHWWADIKGVTPDLAVKDLQVLGTAAFGPVAYFSWRLWLRPAWALGIGVVTALPLIDAYKPFANLVLVIFLPLVLFFLDKLRATQPTTVSKQVRAGIAFGVAFGLLALTYSGWYQWAAPGLVVVGLALIPWRSAPKMSLILVGTTALAFGLVTLHYVLGLLDPAVVIRDDYVYFDVKVEPVYIAMWRGDAPGETGVWPPHGELGGVGLFTVVLALGLGAAIAVGRGSTLLVGTIAIMASAWLLRFLNARKMFDTKLVQLYPRTTPLILYCLMALAGLAAWWAYERWVQRRSRDHVIGAVCALALVFASAASATADRYMPAETDPPGLGKLTMNAHREKNASRKRVLKSYSIPWTRRPSAP